jgi:hypothetical protein
MIMRVQATSYRWWNKILEEYWDTNNLIKSPNEPWNAYYLFIFVENLILILLGSFISISSNQMLFLTDTNFALPIL